MAMASHLEKSNDLEDNFTEEDGYVLGAFAFRHFQCTFALSANRDERGASKPPAGYHTKSCFCPALPLRNLTRIERYTGYACVCACLPARVYLRHL